MDHPTAFLRGINVGANRVPMAELRAPPRGKARCPTGEDLPAERKCGGCSSGDPDDFAKMMSQAIDMESGVHSPVIHRTLEELSAVLAADSLRDIATADKLYQVHFCDRPVPELNLAVTTDPRGRTHRGQWIEITSVRQ